MLQAHGQTRWQIGGIRRKVKLLNHQLRLGGVGRIKGRCHRLRGNLAAIQANGQLRLHFHFPLRRQRTDKRQLQLQSFNFVLHPHQLVVQLHPAIPNLNVVQRQARQPLRLGRRRLWVALQLGQYICKVPLTLRILAHAHHRLIQLQSIKHRRPAPQAAQ